MFGQGVHPVVNPIKQIRDKVNRGHGRSPVVVNLEYLSVDMRAVVTASTQLKKPGRVIS
jgi:hypothetical protein